MMGDAPAAAKRAQPLLSHRDESVRYAAVGAIALIGYAAAGAPLEQVIDDEAGQTKNKPYKDVSEAAAAYETLIREKTGKGYVEAASGG